MLILIYALQLLYLASAQSFTECSTGGLDPGQYPLRFLSASIAYNNDDYILSAIASTNHSLLNSTIRSTLGVLGAVLGSEDPPYNKTCGFLASGSCANDSSIDRNITIIKPVKLRPRLPYFNMQVSLIVQDESGPAAKPLGCVMVATDMPRNTVLHSLFSAGLIAIVVLAGIATLLMHLAKHNASFYTLSSGYHPNPKQTGVVRYGAGLTDLIRFAQFVALTASLGLMYPQFYKTFGVAWIWAVPVWGIFKNVGNDSKAALYQETVGLWQTAAWIDIHPNRLWLNALAAILLLALLVLMWTLVVHFVWWMRDSEVCNWRQSGAYLVGNLTRLVFIFGPGITALAVFQLTIEDAMWTKLVSILVLVVVQVLPITMLSWWLMRSKIEFRTKSNLLLALAPFVNPYKDTRKHWGLVDALKSLVLAIVVGSAVSYPALQVIFILAVELMFLIAMIVRSPLVKNPGRGLFHGIARVLISIGLCGMLASMELVKVMTAYLCVIVAMIVYLDGMFVAIWRISRVMLCCRWQVFKDKPPKVTSRKLTKEPKEPKEEVREQPREIKEEEDIAENVVVVQPSGFEKRPGSAPACLERPTNETLTAAEARKQRQSCMMT